MTSANHGTYTGQYPCDGWVDNLEPTPSVEYPSWFHLLYKQMSPVECATVEQCAYRMISTRSSNVTILVACAPPLVSDQNVSQPCLIKKEKFYTGIRDLHAPLRNAIRIILCKLWSSIIRSLRAYFSSANNLIGCSLVSCFGMFAKAACNVGGNNREHFS